MQSRLSMSRHIIMNQAPGIHPDPGCVSCTRAGGQPYQLSEGNARTWRANKSWQTLLFTLPLPVLWHFFFFFYYSSLIMRNVLSVTSALSVLCSFGCIHLLLGGYKQNNNNNMISNNTRVFFFLSFFIHQFTFSSVPVVTTCSDAM